MSFGLCNAPVTFQRLMEHCMGELNLRDCLIYLNKMIIVSSTFEEHLGRLEAVFSRLKEHNLKLRADKCEFLKSRVIYLGHVVSENGWSWEDRSHTSMANTKNSQRCPFFSRIHWILQPVNPQLFKNRATTMTSLWDTVPTRSPKSLSQERRKCPSNGQITTRSFQHTQGSTDEPTSVGLCRLLLAVQNPYRHFNNWFGSSPIPAPGWTESCCCIC